MKHLMAILIVGIALAGCSSTSMSAWKSAPETTAVQLSEAEIATVQHAVSQRLRNPASATFQNIRASQAPDGTKYVCGQYNGTNGFGGYVGFTPFAGVLSASGFEWVLEGGYANQDYESAALCERYVPAS